LANILDKFNFTAVGSSGRIVDYTSRISPSGDFSKIFDLDAIITSWKNILSTPKGSMDHDPEFGSNLYLFLFEPADSNTKEAIKNDIIQSLATYDDRAKIEKIDTVFLRNKKGFNINIVVDYQGNNTNLNLAFDENNYQNFI
jgi:phage baseplate assembly protein W